MFGVQSAGVSQRIQKTIRGYAGELLVVEVSPERRSRGQELVHRAIRACHMNHEHAKKSVGQPLVLVKELYVEEVARVAAVQCRMEFAAI